MEAQFRHISEHDAVAQYGADLLLLLLIILCVCRWVTKHSDPVAATAWHMVLGGVMLAGAAVAADGSSGDLAGRLAQFSSSDALAMAYVSLLGGAASYG